MRILVSGSTRTVGQLARQYAGSLGHLLTPANRNGVYALLRTGLPWAADNGAYAGFDPPAFRRLLRRVAGQPGLLWIACPDVVADARQTLQRFDQWHEEVARAGPVALVGQDGQEDLDLPWERLACLFVGGSTRWKLSQAAADLIGAARRRGKAVHLGRVNTLRRLQAAFDKGCDSVDGSGYSRWADDCLERSLRFVRQLGRQPTLFACS